MLSFGCAVVQQAKGQPTASVRVGWLKCHSVSDVVSLPAPALLCCAQASPEWGPRDPLPVPVAAGGSLFGVPYDAELFSTQQLAVAAAPPPAAGSAVAAVLGSS